MAQLARPPLQKHGPIADLLLTRAPLVFLRADAGFGGTRLLTELEAACLPGRSLLLATAGAEPLGALRCAFVRSIAMHGPPPEGALEEDERAALAQVLAGNGAKLPLVAKLVASWVKLPWRRHRFRVEQMIRHAGDHPRRRCAWRSTTLRWKRSVRASLAPAATIRLVVRLDSASSIPPLLGSLQAGREFHLGPLPRPLGEQLANAIASGQLSPEGQKRWARRGRYLPLGITEALLEGVISRRAHVGRWSDRAG